MNTEITIDIHKIEENCPAWEEGNRYGFHVTGGTFGCSSPCKDRDEILDGIRRYINAEEDYYGCKLRIVHLVDSSGLKISIEEIKGTKNLKDWFN